MKILITGGTGSLGRSLVKAWHKQHQLTILSRNPHKQQALQGQFSLEPAAFILADIENYRAIRDACRGQDILIHAAALKVVSLGEQSPAEYHRVNAIGSQVVARAWADTHRDGTGQALYINSDKAVSPINFYGVTKRIGETFFVERGYSSIRYGNVVESDGSFIHKWQALRLAARPLKVRFPTPTRFFLAMDEAIELIEAALELDGKTSGIFVPHAMSAFDLLEVARAMTADVNICREILLPGEKQHEVLLQEGEVAEWAHLLLSRVTPGWAEAPTTPFSSRTANKLTGPEILKRLHISPAQEVFC